MDTGEVWCPLTTALFNNVMVTIYQQVNNVAYISP